MHCFLAGCWSAVCPEADLPIPRVARSREPRGHADEPQLGISSPRAKQLTDPASQRTRKSEGRCTPLIWSCHTLHSPTQLYLASCMVSFARQVWLRRGMPPHIGPGKWTQNFRALPEGKMLSGLVSQRGETQHSAGSFVFETGRQGTSFAQQNRVSSS